MHIISGDDHSTSRRNSASFCPATQQSLHGSTVVLQTLINTRVSLTAFGGGAGAARHFGD